MRVARWAIYRHQLDQLPGLLEMLLTYSYIPFPITMEEVLEQVFNNPFDADWASQFPQPLFEAVLELTLRQGLWELEPTQVQFSCLEEIALAPEPECSDQLLLCGVEQFILRNQLAAAETCLAQISAKMRGENRQYDAWIAFLKGDRDQAIGLYENALQALKKTSRKRKVFLLI